MANGRSNHPMYRNGNVGGYEEDRSVSPRAQTDYRQMNAQQMDRRREDEFARQDAALDQIHRGVKGLKNQAHAINDEVVDQTKLIGDIGDRMDDAQGDLERGEAKARDVNSKKAKVCKMYGVIAVLVLAEVVMSIAGIPFMG